MDILAVQSTVCMSLLQPQRETYNLFDDVLLMADGELYLRSEAD